MPYLFDPEPPRTVPIVGQDAAYPIRRMFCVGRNYAAHAAEMGSEVDREAPWYFMKGPHAATVAGGIVPYASGTEDLHYEVELVVALGAKVEPRCTKSAIEAVYGYCCGLDMTRRDLQQVGKDNRRPWDLGKDIENGAILAPLTPSSVLGSLSDRRITLRQNGVLKQDGSLRDMVWSVTEIIAHLSQYYRLGAGDIIMTGTPAGVGPVAVGDRLEGAITGLAPLSVLIGEAE